MTLYASRNFLRRITIFSPLRDSLQEPLKPGVVESKGKTSQMWKKVFIYICLPSIALAGINVYLEEEPERPEFKPYPFLRKRTKKFPWGDGNKSLFHNPHTNALPDGYEQ